MRHTWVNTVMRTIVALVAGAIGFTVAMNLLDTEAGGGGLTGPLIRLCLAASVVLVVCGLLAFARRRIVSVVGIAAAAMCLPLFVYRIAPNLLAWATDASASVGAAQAPGSDPLAIGGVVAVLLVWGVYGRTRSK